MAELPPPIQALLNPEIYPHRPQRVELVQTQSSFIFLTGEYVYKVKKPVNFGFLDYSTLEKRHTYCCREVELNARLCRDIYRGVAEVREKDGQYSIGGEGVVVEYAVHMRQLPRDRMMDTLLDEDKVTPDMVQRLAEVLSTFHREAATSPEISRYGGLDVITHNTKENFSQTDGYVGRSITAEQYRDIARYTRAFLRRKAVLFQRRIVEGRIRDCHGDLHTAHVCFTDDICIYDCIEFNERFRYSDVAADIAFLAMDIDYHGRQDVSEALLEAYSRHYGDADLPRLLNFYKCYRAYVRGKVTSFKLDDPLVPPAEKEESARIASRYFQLAHSYVLAEGRPLLILVGGLIGTGKTTVAEALAERGGFTLVSSDVVRKALVGIAPTDRRWESYEAGIYSPEYTERTYDELFRRAKEALSEGDSVILDASFKKASDRERAKALAEEVGAELWVVECTADEDTIRSRLEERARTQAVSDGRWDIFEDIRRGFEPIREVPQERHLTVNTARPLKEVLREVEERIARKLRGGRWLES